MRSILLSALCAFVSARIATATTSYHEEVSSALGVVRMNTHPAVPPVVRGPVEVGLGLSPIKFRDVDTAKGEVEMVLWLDLTWTDSRLAWWTGRGSSGNVSRISVETKHVWMPDIIPYNLVEATEDLSPKLVVISSDGKVLYVPALRLRFHCNLEGLVSSAGANCTVKFGSWTHSGLVLDLKEPDAPDMSNYVSDPKFELLNVYAEREQVTYPCCPENYVDIKFTFNMRLRQSGYWPF